MPGIVNLGATGQAFGSPQSETAHPVVADVLLDLKDQPLPLIVQVQGIKQIGQLLGRKLNVNDGTTLTAVSQTTDLTDTAGVLAEINLQLSAGGNNISVVAGAGTDDIDFTNSVIGADARIELTTFVGLGNLQLGAAPADLAVGGTSDTDFSVNSLSFDVFDGFTTATIALAADYVNIAGVEAEIQTQLTAQGSLVNSAVNANAVDFANLRTGIPSQITLSNFVGAGDITHVASSSLGTLYDR